VRHIHSKGAELKDYAASEAPECFDRAEELALMGCKKLDARHHGNQWSVSYPNPNNISVGSEFYKGG